MKKLNIKTIAFAGVLIAMNLVLARVLAINIGPTLRITLSTTPIFLAGLWFGPAVGGICGVSADLLGCMLQGYAPNPFILVTSLLSGVLPAVMKKYLFHDRINLWKIAVIVAIYYCGTAYFLWNSLGSSLYHQSDSDGGACNCKFDPGIDSVPESPDYFCYQGTGGAEGFPFLNGGKRM